MSQRRRLPNLLRWRAVGWMEWDCRRLMLLDASMCPKCCSATLGSIPIRRFCVQKTCSRPTTSYNTCRRPFSSSFGTKEKNHYHRSSLQTTFKHQEEESPLLRCEIVFTMQVCACKKTIVCVPPQQTTAKEPFMLGKRTCFWTQQQWASVLFTDESRFTMESDSGVY
ncbi:HTH_Tnp_Tc3_2 domain-containing protein [Trichonephila clavipes]|nr:HTH_Tnp_Tc3_2 domain-containing protein [Trichonephila clavipes]